MKLDYDQIMRQADVYYGQAALRRLGISAEDAASMTPEEIPRIYSEQVRALARALVEAINQQ